MRSLGKGTFVCLATAMACSVPGEDALVEDVAVDELALVVSGPLEFSEACRPGTTTVIGAVGDIMMHDNLQQQVYASPARWRSVWGDVIPLLQQADVTYGNLEGAVARG